MQKALLFTLIFFLGHNIYSQEFNIYMDDLSGDFLDDYPVDIETINDTSYVFSQNQYKDAQSNEIRLKTTLQVIDPLYNIIQEIDIEDVYIERWHDQIIVTDSLIIIAGYIPNNFCETIICVYDRKNITLQKYISITPSVQGGCTEITSFSEFNEYYLLGIVERGENEERIDYLLVLSQSSGEVIRRIDLQVEHENANVYGIYQISESQFISYLSARIFLENGMKSKRKMLQIFDNNFALNEQYIDQINIAGEIHAYVPNFWGRDKDFYYSDCNYSGSQCSIIKSDSTLIEKWSFSFQDEISINKIKELNDGNLLVAGFNRHWFDENEIQWPILENHYGPQGGFTSGYLRKIDATNGEIIWEKTYININEYGFVESRRILDFAENENGEIIILSYNESTLDELPNSNYHLDSHIFKINSHGCLDGGQDCGFYQFLGDIPTENEDLGVESAIEISPNPVKNIISLKLYGAKANFFNIYNLAGTELLKGSLPNEVINDIDVRNLIEGYYLLKITTDSGVLFLKFIKV